ncbi:prohibitin family protein [Priestia filamentosa]|uniref:prohibitin family protein n=1 Tax=Priestia filamentosa TaxID=1402861 RepID=UPI0006918E35
MLLRNKIGLVAGVAVLAVVGLNSFTIVPAGHSGVVLHLQEVQPKVYAEGLHFKTPFISNIIPIEVRIQKSESTQTSASSDLQNVTTTLAVNYSLNPSTVNKLYKEVGLDYRARIVEPAISESLKAVTAKYTAEELITRRPEVSVEVQELLTKKLTKYNIKLNEISITEFKFSDTFNDAIEAKQTAEQESIKAERVLDKVKIEAEQKITQAKAEAESLKLKKQEVTPELVRLKEIEVQEKALDIQEKALKVWDGALPSVTGGATPFIDFTSKVK